MKKIITVAIIMVYLFTVCGCKKNVLKNEELTAMPETLAPEKTATPEITLSPTPEEETMPTYTPEAVILPSKTEEPTPIQTATPEPVVTEKPEKTEEPIKQTEKIYLDSSWEFADYSVINSGNAVLYRAENNRKNIVIGVNAGHGTKGGTKKKTYCHPDKTPKLTSGTTAKGSIQAVAVSSGMTFSDGTPEGKVNLRTAQLLKEMLLQEGYDVLMLRDGDDVQLDNVARTVICNNLADCHIAIHFDGDGLDYDKGCFYLRAPEGLKSKYPVADTWQKSHRLGDSIIEGLRDNGNKIRSSGYTLQDLTQTSYSKVPTVNIELGNQSSKHDDKSLLKLCNGLKDGINRYFG